MKLFLFLLCLFSITVYCQIPECEYQGYSNDLLCSSWLLNVVNSSIYFDSLTSVQNATAVQENGSTYMKIDCTGIPQYNHVMTSSDINWLNSRPHASTDFDNGRTTATVGETILFGEDIGYSSTHCTLGYWPKGPECPSSSDKVGYFPLNPEKSSETCYTTLGKIGFWVNGVSVYNWWDGTSYNNANEWHTMAAYAEYYDMDICSGHAANGDYHHHTYPNCLGSLLNDDGSSKSPIYGFAADGFPIMGPWIEKGVLAKSCWKNRDYDDPSSSTGCGTAHKRSCLLVDQYDISKGTTTASSSGPDTNAYVTTQSGNTLQASSGFYFEDHYYDASCSEQGEDYLDEYNGRYDDVYGYVYHITIENIDAEFVTTTFPHFVGPTFYGKLDSNAVASCASSAFQAPSGGGSGGPPQGPPHPQTHF